MSSLFCGHLLHARTVCDANFTCDQYNPNMFPISTRYSSFHLLLHYPNVAKQLFFSRDSALFFKPGVVQVGLRGNIVAT